MTVLSLADARASLSKHIESAATTHERFEITRNGARVAVLLSADDYDSLVETVDILAELSRQKEERCVIGFAAETDNVVEYAQRKLARKGCDAIIANDVSRADSGFGTDTNKAWIVSTAGTQELPVLTKPQLADTILDLLQNL